MRKINESFTKKISKTSANTIQDRAKIVTPPSEQELVDFIYPSDYEKDIDDMDRVCNLYNTNIKVDFIDLICSKELPYEQKLKDIEECDDEIKEHIEDKCRISTLWASPSTDENGKPRPFLVISVVLPEDIDEDMMNNEMYYDEFNDDEKIEIAKACGYYTSNESFTRKTSTTSSKDIESIAIRMSNIDTQIKDFILTHENQDRSDSEFYTSVYNFVREFKYIDDRMMECSFQRISVALKDFEIRNGRRKDSIYLHRWDGEYDCDVLKKDAEFKYKLLDFLHRDSGMFESFTKKSSSKFPFELTKSTGILTDTDTESLLIKFIKSNRNTVSSTVVSKTLSYNIFQFKKMMDISDEDSSKIKDCSDFRVVGINTETNKRTGDTYLYIRLLHKDSPVEYSHINQNVILCDKAIPAKMFSDMFLKKLYAFIIAFNESFIKKTSNKSISDLNGKSDRIALGMVEPCTEIDYEQNLDDCSSDMNVWFSDPSTIRDTELFYKEGLNDYISEWFEIWETIDNGPFGDFDFPEDEEESNTYLTLKFKTIRGSKYSLFFDSTDFNISLYKGYNLNNALPIKVFKNEMIDYVFGEGDFNDFIKEFKNFFKENIPLENQISESFTRKTAKKSSSDLTSHSIDINYEDLICEFLQKYGEPYGNDCFDFFFKKSVEIETDCKDLEPYSKKIKMIRFYKSRFDDIKDYFLVKTLKGTSTLQTKKGNLKGDSLYNTNLDYNKNVSKESRDNYFRQLLKLLMDEID